MKLPAGFSVGGIKDGSYGVGVVKSEISATVAAVFTKNALVGAHIPFDKEQLANSNWKASLLAINSGNANCATPTALQDAEQFSLLAAKKFETPTKHVLVASTGVIGVPLSLETISRRLDWIRLGTTETEILAFAHAIMTTDKKPKIAVRFLSDYGITITGFAKGAGMIAPNMATMLCVILTDASFEHATLQSMLKRCVSKTFNSITIDGDTSPNDSVFLFANGLKKHDAKAKSAFEDALLDLCKELALMILEDGEGVTRIMEISVTGAETDEKARELGFAVGNSPLVKTAIHGKDENWGRILSALGKCGVAKASVWVQTMQVAKDGVVIANERKGILDEPRITIMIKVGDGNGAWTVWASDLSREYVEINAHYMT